MDKTILELVRDEVTVVSDGYQAEWAVIKEKYGREAAPFADSGESAIVLSAVIICKNEEDSIERCIRSLCDQEFDEIVVIDTGSEDKTPDILRTLNKEIRIIQIYNHKWQDNFAEARNFGLDMAGGNWVFFIDADEYLISHDRRSIKELLELYARLTGGETGISPVIISAGGNRLYNNPRIFCRGSGFRYYGFVHEMLRIGGEEFEFIPFIGLNIQIGHGGYDRKVYVKKDKTKRNTDLLYKTIAEEPKNPLWHCYLLRDGREILSDAEKDREYQFIKHICSGSRNSRLFKFCRDWAAVMHTRELLTKENVDAAELCLKDIESESGLCTADLHYLRSLLKLKQIERQLKAMAKESETFRGLWDRVPDSLINTEGYHIDEAIMRIHFARHEMADYRKYQDFLYDSGYFG